MKKYFLLFILIIVGCSINHVDINYKKSEIDKNSKSAESEVWCEVLHCFNGGGFKGVLKLHVIISKRGSYKIIYDGISHDCINSYDQINKFAVSKENSTEFIQELKTLGIFELNTIDLNKIPEKENVLNPWEDSFTKIPPTNYMLFKYFIKIGNRTHEFEGGNIEIYKDFRYKKIVELFNEFFNARLGDLKFD